MKTLILVLLSLLIPFEAESQPLLLIPVGQDSVPMAYLTFGHDSVMASLNPRSIWSFGDDPRIWFSKPDSSDITVDNISRVRVWAYIDPDVEIEVAGGWDKLNLWTLHPQLENPLPPTHGYGAYDYVFAQQDLRASTFISVARHAWKEHGQKNGQGRALIDCVEILPQVQNGVALERTPSKQLKYFDLLGREVQPTHSGVYVTSNHTKILIVR